MLRTLHATRSGGFGQICIADATGYSRACFSSPITVHVNCSPWPQFCWLGRPRCQPLRCVHHARCLATYARTHATSLIDHAHTRTTCGAIGACLPATSTHNVRIGRCMLVVMFSQQRIPALPCDVGGSSNTPLGTGVALATHNTCFFIYHFALLRIHNAYGIHIPFSSPWGRMASRVRTCRMLASQAATSPTRRKAVCSIALCAL